MKFINKTNTHWPPKSEKFWDGYEQVSIEMCDNPVHEEAIAWVLTHAIEKEIGGISYNYEMTVYEENVIEVVVTFDYKGLRRKTIVFKPTGLPRDVYVR